MEENKDLNKSLVLLARSSIVVFIGVVLSKIFTYIYKIIVARSFDPSTFGLLNLALIIVSLIVSIASMGMTEGLLRFISLDRNSKSLKKSKYLYNFTIRTLLLFSIISGFILYFFSEQIATGIFSKPFLEVYLRYFSIIIPLTVIGGIFLSVLRAFEDIKSYVFLQNILQNMIKLLVLVILLFIGFKISSIISSYLLGALGFVVLAYWFSRKYVKNIRSATDLGKAEERKLRKHFLSYSWPIVFFGVSTSLFYWSDSFVIGYFLPIEDLGFYNVAFTISSILGIASELFMQLFFPLVVKEYSKKNIKLIREISKQVAKWMLLVNIPIFTAIFFFPGVIINILFGSEYLIAENSLRILAVASLFASTFMGLGTNLLAMKGKSKLLLINSIGLTIFNFVLNIILVQRYGINGVAFATSVSWILFSVILVIETKHHLKIIPLRRKMLNLLAIGFILAGGLYFLKDISQNNLALATLMYLLYCLAYLLLVFLTGCLDENDKFMVSYIYRKFKTRNRKSNQD